MNAALARGPLLIGVEGPVLTNDDRRRLLDSRVGGVILFTRNFVDRGQVAALIEDIRALRSPALLVSVDHEGGRVQRFREGFSAIPPMRGFGSEWDGDVAAAARDARACGLLIAQELRAIGVDFSFTPVLDLD